MSDTVKVLRCAVGLNPEVVEVETFEDLRHQCGSEKNPYPYITKLPVHLGGTPFDLWCDEDGDPKGLPLNQRIAGYPILGTFVMTLRLDGEAITGLNGSQITMLKRQLAEWRR